jgi:CRISPR-associated protein Cst2
MQRHVLFSAIDRLNMADPEAGQTYVSNGDGISSAVEVDLRADMGGFMHTSKGNYSGRRISPISVTPPVAMEASNIGRDLMVRINVSGEGKDQALATREFSQSDDMLMSFHLDIIALSTSKYFEYGKDKNGFHMGTKYVKHVPEQERMRRVRLFLEATRSLSDYANQARNAVAGEPRQVLIVFDNKMSRKAIRYFEANAVEQQHILAELQARGAQYFLGDDTQGNTSVDQAYQQAYAVLAKSVLFDPANGDAAVKSFEQAFGKA